MTRIFKLLGTKNRPYSNQALRVWWKVAAAAFFPLDTRHAGSAVGYQFFQQKTTSYPTWKMFSCLRFYNFSLPAAETAATRMSFSSYPGAITSRALGCSGAVVTLPSPCGLHSTLRTLPFSQGTDDFYMLNSGLLLSSSGAFWQTKNLQCSGRDQNSPRKLGVSMWRLRGQLCCQLQTPRYCSHGNFPGGLGWQRVG